MVIPAGKVVKFIVTADDVIHSFAVPAFWTKLDANPGQLNETWVKVDRPGVYFGQCSRAVRRAPRLHADRGRGRAAGAVRAVGRLQGRAHAGRQAAARPTARRLAGQRRPRDAAPPPSRNAAAGPAAQQPATNQAATAQN